MTDDTPGTGPEWPTGRLISAVARRIERDWNTHLDRWGLNHASLPVLFLLSGGPLSQQQLAARCDVTQQTMSRIVARLERLGYVERRRHSTDARSNEVALTPAGRDTLREAGDPAVVDRIGERGLSGDQVEALRGLLMAALSASATDGPADGDAPDNPGPVPS